MYQAQFQKIFEIQKQIKDIHPLLERVFPVVVAKDGHFLILMLTPLERSMYSSKRSPRQYHYPKNLGLRFRLSVMETEPPVWSQKMRSTPSKVMS